VWSPEQSAQLGRTFRVLGALVGMMFRTTFYAAGNVVAIVLRVAKRLAFMTL